MASRNQSPIIGLALIDACHGVPVVVSSNLTAPTRIIKNLPSSRRCQILALATLLPNSTFW